MKRFPGTFKCKVTCLDLTPGCQVSIYSTVLHKKTPELTVAWLQKNADARGTPGRTIYEVSTQEEYDAHYKAIRKLINAAKD